MSERRRAVILATLGTAAVAALALYVSATPAVPVAPTGPRDPGLLAVRAVRESDVAARARPHASSDVVLEQDTWDVDGTRHDVAYLRSTSREALQAGLAQVARAGIQPAAGAEWLVGRDPRTLRDEVSAASYRTYEVDLETIVDASMVASATGTNDSATSRPLVALTLTAAGSERFCNATKQLVGQKIAIVIGGEVVSAPIVASAVCGGRLSIALPEPASGSTETERDALVAALGGRTERGMTWWDRTQPRTWPARLLFILGLGVLGGGLMLLVLRLRGAGRR